MKFLVKHDKLLSEYIYIYNFKIIMDPFVYVPFKLIPVRVLCPELTSWLCEISINERSHLLVFLQTTCILLSYDNISFELLNLV